MQKLINTLKIMQHSKIDNYILAGLTSTLISGDGFGTVRYFEKARHQLDSITPHSHRFDFTCLVLQGHVINREWDPCTEAAGDLFQSSILTYKGEIGKHVQKVHDRDYYKFYDTRYEVGDCYSMTSEQIHSITFSKNAKVLFFSGPDKFTETTILEPVVNDIVIPTYLQPSWMFNGAK